MSEQEALFVFPPFVESALNGPHLAGPLLAALCEREGIRTTVLDWNIRVIRDLLADYANDSGGVKSNNNVPKIFSPALASVDPRVARQILQFFRSEIFPTPQSLEEIELYDFRFCRSNADNIYSQLIDSDIPQNCIVCITVAFAEQLIEALHIATIIKGRCAEQRILIGGSQINLLPDFLIKKIVDLSIVDVVAIGNGEGLIVDLIKKCAIDASSNVARSGKMTRLDLESLPLPKFGSLSLYFRPINIPVMVTKGCFWGECSFCDYVKLSDIGSLKFISRAPEAVLSEMKVLSGLIDVGKFVLISDAVPPAWYARLAAIAKEESFPLRTWAYMIHHDKLEQKVFDLLKSASASTINFGTESFSNKILRVMKKQATSEVAIRNIQEAHCAGLSVVVNIIPDYPRSSLSDVTETFETLTEIQKSIDVINPQAFDLTFDTDVANRPEEYGLRTVTGAYERSAHGYHTIPFEQESGLTDVERSASIEMMKRLSLSHRIGRRNGFLDLNQLDDGVRLSYDESYYVKDDISHLASVGISLRAGRSGAEALRFLYGGAAVSRKIANTKREWFQTFSSPETETNGKILTLEWLYNMGFIYVSDGTVANKYP